MRASAALVALYALAVFLAAALLFGLEPMFGKMALPLLGGAPAVWNVALVFYQIALLAGYALAHLIAGRVRPRLQALAYVALVAVGLVVLPIRVAGGFRPDLSVVPIGPLFGLFSISLGLPFVALAAGSPLLQSWFARLPAVRGRDPYVLYAASNAGSLGALAAYPLAVEPYVGLRLQSATWAVVYALYLLLAGACGVALLRGAPADVESVARSANEPTLRLRSYWIALALVPSALMVAVTNHIETAVAAMPLLWTLPLGAYLLTFVIAFSGRPEQTRAIALRLRPYVLLPLVLLVSIGLALPAEWYVALSVVAFAVLALACHAELAATRPEASRLTEFYLLVALGGALGGSFVALFAPLALPTVAEYPLAIVAACALVAPAAKSDLCSRFLNLFLP
ncbi:MAG TPA: hypothetical protein VKG44_05280, partial [Candidatus Baltobacteraceae bacterium]|nr:hypothetical protein [Candidatus Baltobacteraceae bacterium]